MANVQHSSLTGAELHEPKGADSASSGEVYVSDGAGSGAWGLAETLGATKDVAGTDGYVKLPGGVIIQWGLKSNVAYSTDTSVSFSTAFPNACFGITGSFAETHNVAADANTHAISFFSKTTSGFTVRHGCSSTTPIDIFWIAVGY